MLEPMPISALSASVRSHVRPVLTSTIVVSSVSQPVPSGRPDEAGVYADSLSTPRGGGLLLTEASGAGILAAGRKRIGCCVREMRCAGRSRGRLVPSDQAAAGAAAGCDAAFGLFLLPFARPGPRRPRLPFAAPPPLSTCCPRLHELWHPWPRGVADAGPRTTRVLAPRQ